MSRSRRCRVHEFVESQVVRIAAALEAVIRSDRNAVACGFAMGAFHRLTAEVPALRLRADEAIGNCPVQCLDVLDRASSWAGEELE